jgi:hypothetical protein
MPYVRIHLYACIMFQLCACGAVGGRVAGCGVGWGWGAARHWVAGCGEARSPQPSPLPTGLFAPPRSEQRPLRPASPSAASPPGLSLLGEHYLV